MLESILKFKKYYLLSILFFILLFLRRGDQLLMPGVWNEDGTQIIPSFIEHGWSNLLIGVNGYLITIPKLISNLSMSLSPLYYPEISTIITWVFTIFVGLAVAFSPTRLHYRWVAALFVFLIPTSAECYGLPLYTIWFSAILLFLVVLWEQGRGLVFKNTLLIMGGLSSPVIVPVALMQLFRVLALRQKREEVITLLIAVVLSAIQVYYILNTPATKENIFFELESHTLPDLLQAAATKFFALFYVRAFTDFPLLLLLCGLALFVLLLGYWVKNTKDHYFTILLAILVSSILLTIARMGVYAIDPIYNGPRYLFLPYIALAWSVLYIAKAQAFFKIASATILLLALLNTLNPHFAREVDNLFWKENLINCANSHQPYGLPIHSGGSAKSTLSLSLPPDVCSNLYASNPLPVSRKIKSLKALETYAVGNGENPFCVSLQDNDPFCSQDAHPKNLELVTSIDHLVLFNGWISGASKSLEKACNAYLQIEDKSYYLYESYDRYSPNQQKYSRELLFNLEKGSLEMTLYAMDTSCSTLNKVATLTVDVITPYQKITSMQPTKEGFKYNIEQSRVAKDELEIKGWFFDLKANFDTLPYVFAVIGDEAFQAEPWTRRDDVARAFDNTHYTFSGFRVAIPVETLTAGKHSAKIYALSHDKKTLFELPEVVSFEVQ
jgi:hypothetical protein